jgi:hypothetical protein
MSQIDERNVIGMRKEKIESSTSSNSYDSESEADEDYSASISSDELGDLAELEESKDYRLQFHKSSEK